MTGISRVIARLLDGRETAVVGESSSTAAHGRLLPPDATVSPKISRSFWRRRPRPEASISTKSSSTFMARFLSVGKMCPSKLALAVSGAAGTAGEVRSTFDPPGDRAAVAATTPSGAILNSICSVFRFIRVERPTTRKIYDTRMVKSKISRTDDERRGGDRLMINGMDAGRKCQKMSKSVELRDKREK